MALNAWHFAAAWHALAPPGYPLLPRQLAQYKEALWAEGLLTVAVPALPFVLYPRDIRRPPGTGRSRHMA